MTTQTVAPSRSAEHGLRRFDAPRDLQGVIELLELGFHRDLDERDRKWLRDLNALTGLGPVFKLVASAMTIGDGAFSGYVFYRDGRLVGNVSLIRRPDGQWTIANVVTHPSVRRQGIARQLMRAAIRAARQRGAPAVELQVRDDNRAAVALYEDLGFRARDAHVTYRATSPRAVVSNGPGWGRPSTFTVDVPRRRDDPRIAAFLNETERPATRAQVALLRRSMRRGGVGHRVVDWIRGRAEHVVAAYDDQMVGGMGIVILAERGGVHRAAFVVHPAWRGRVEHALVDGLFRRVRSAATAEMEVEVPERETGLTDALERATFRRVKILVRFALDID